ncbi:IS3 family transposase [Sulfobacillus thermosulfidooxidans]|uniref:IS3 family transposase n=1 Tax=Sulfobacillus thermosulfidooxidans TaxID=28034 RepID=UPI001494FD1A
MAEEQVLEWLSEFITAGEGPCYGYRQWTTWLRREHDLIINKKTVYRLLRAADLLQGQRLRSPDNRPPRVIAANRVVTGPNPLGEMDGQYGYIAGEDRFFYLCSVIDVFDRSILAYHIRSHWFRCSGGPRLARRGTSPSSGLGEDGPGHSDRQWAPICGPSVGHRMSGLRDAA